MLKNIIFDVGDVLLAYRWRYPLEKAGLSSEEAARVGQEMFSDHLWTRLDLGELSLAELKAAYQEKYPADADAIGYFLDHPELMPLPRPLVWKKVHELKEAGYQIYLLSNYSEELLVSHTRGAEFWYDLDGAIISAKVHAVKPEPEIYEKLLTLCDLKAEECLFFDDRKQNVEGARAMGIPSVQVHSQWQLLQELDAILEGRT